MRTGIRKSRGFTLIELIVVMAILGILATIGIPHLVKAPVRAKETALRENLFTFRSMLDQFYADKQRYPESLDELVSEGYIRKVPIDPLTKTADTWVLEYEEADPDAGEADQPPGIIDVKSGAKGAALDGTSYDSW